MSEFMFGSGPGHLTNSANEIAEKHDAWLVNYTEPRGEKRHWFATKNLGNPFDGATAKAVLADVEAAGGCREDADSEEE